jgi:hypothetical protein
VKFPVGVPTKIKAFFESRLKLAAASPFNPLERRASFMRLVDAYIIGEDGPRERVFDVEVDDIFSLRQLLVGYLIHERLPDIPKARGFTKDEQRAASDWAKRLLPVVERLERGGVVDLLGRLDVDASGG